MPAERYQEVLRRWTRSRAITMVQDLNTTLRVYATLQAPEFNAAYVAKHVQLFRLPPTDADKLAQQLSQSWSRYFPFVLVAATHDLSWNDFNRPRSQWRVALFNDAGAQLDAVEIRPQRRTSSVERALFPHLDPFFRLYYLRFPRYLPDGRPLVGPTTRRLILSISGPLGKAELVWRLR